MNDNQKMPVPDGYHVCFNDFSAPMARTTSNRPVADFVVLVFDLRLVDDITQGSLTWQNIDKIARKETWSHVQ